MPSPPSVTRLPTCLCLHTPFTTTFTIPQRQAIPTTDRNGDRRPPRPLPIIIDFAANCHRSTKIASVNALATCNRPRNQGIPSTHLPNCTNLSGIVPNGPTEVTIPTRNLLLILISDARANSQLLHRPYRATHLPNNSKKLANHSTLDPY